MTDKAKDIIEDLRERGCDDKEIMYAMCDGEYLAKRPDITQDLAEEVYDIMHTSGSWLDSIAIV